MKPIRKWFHRNMFEAVAVRMMAGAMGKSTTTECVGGLVNESINKSIWADCLWSDSTTLISEHDSSLFKSEVRQDPLPGFLQDHFSLFGEP